MKIYYHEDYEEEKRKVKSNWVTFASIFGLELEEEFHCRNYDMGLTRTFKITEYGVFQKTKGKWCDTCNFESAVLSGTLRFIKEEY